MLRPFVLPVSLASGALLAVSTAQAATFVDPFTDGVLVGGTDNSGLDWYRRSANQSITIVDDSAGIGTGNALKLTITNGTQIDRAVIGLFSAFTLANVGDQISLAFDFRLEATPTVNTADGFRFGFYNSNGSVVATNGGTESDNDFGYQATIGTGTTPGFNLNKETNSGAGGLGSNNPNADRNSLSPTVLNTVAINDTLKHSATFTITRTASGVSLSSSVDGQELGTATNTTSPFFTFDEVVFNHATPQNFFLDNVNVTTTVVPEPTSTLLIGLGAAGLLMRRRR